MIVDKYGRVAGSIDLATLAQMYAQTDNDDLRAHYRQVAAENGLDLDGTKDLLAAVVDADSAGAVRGIDELGAESDVEPEDREDGVHSVGGGWHEVVVGGEVIDKIRGADAAQEAYEAYQEANGGNDDVS